MVYYGLLTILIVMAVFSLMVSGAPNELTRLLQRLLTLEGLKMLGAFVFVAPAFLVLNCAVPASLMMGVCAAIQWRPSTLQEGAEESSEASAQTEATLKEGFSVISSGSQREA